MPFARPKLSALITQATQDVAAALPGTDPLLRFSNLGIIARVVAGMAQLHYGYIDWISQQCNPFTATDEFLEAWAALKSVFRLAATSASGTVSFTGTNGSTIPAGTELVRGDGQKFTTTADGTISGGSVTARATAVPDPGGLLGVFGNTDSGSTMTLGAAVAGVNSNGVVTAAFTGGADIETDESLRARMLLAYQNPAHGGSEADYGTWAREVAGVSRVWVVPRGYGVGSVVVYVMLDIAEASHNGFPQGSNGVATGESRDVPATGDQLAVANHILLVQPVTSLVYVVAPTAAAIDFTLTGLTGASATTRNAITSAINAVFTKQGSAKGSTVTLSAIEAAIAALPDTGGFVITEPTGNIVTSVGSLPVAGVLTLA